jgi:ABC-type oligopeptide transport system substrate-binding subunit
VPSTWEIYLGLNAFKKPLSDVRVRQALNYATDVDSIVKNVLDGNGRRQEGPFTPVMFGYDASVKGYTPDPARARIYDELFAEYRSLHDHFGRGGDDVMKRLRALRTRSAAGVMAGS